MPDLPQIVYDLLVALSIMVPMYLISSYCTAKYLDWKDGWKDRKDQGDV